MVADRYIKLVLTIIAVELLWLGLRDAPIAHAQQKPAPTEVIVTGVRIGQQGHSMLPVVVMGGAQRLPGISDVRGVEPLVVRIPAPIQAQVQGPVAISQPLTVRTAGEPLVVRVPDPIQAQINGLVAVSQPLVVRTAGEPLVVDVLPGRPTQRPGIQ